MSINVTTEVFCEFGDCQHSYAYGSDAGKIEARLVRKQAKQQGWSRVDGKDYCPTHKPTRVTALTFPQAS